MWAHGFTPIFWWDLCCSSFSFLCFVCHCSVTFVHYVAYLSFLKCAIQSMAECWLQTTSLTPLMRIHTLIPISSVKVSSNLPMKVTIKTNIDWLVLMPTFAVFQQYRGVKINNLNLYICNTRDMSLYGKISGQLLILSQKPRKDNKYWPLLTEISQKFMYKNLCI